MQAEVGASQTGGTTATEQPSAEPFEEPTMEDVESEYELAEYKWYACPFCVRCWSVEQMEHREKLCEFCTGLPKPMLIKRAEKPEYFMDMTEANIIKPSQEVAIMDGTTT